MKMHNYSPLSERIESLDHTALTPIVQHATNCKGPLTHWQAVRVTADIGGFSSSLIYRFSGKIQDTEQEKPWSLILKVISPAHQSKGLMSNEMGDVRREFEFCSSGLWKEFPTSFRAADSYAQYEKIGPTGLPEYWIWLEDMGQNNPNQWNLDDLYKVALSLGKFNGSYLSNKPLPEASWMKKEMIRQYLRMTEPSFQLLFALRELPVIRILFPPNHVDSLVQLWQDRQEHLALLERLPQTLCHGDAQFSNLFLVPNSSGGVETVAIDRSSVGIASIGVDLAQFFMLKLFFTDPPKIQALESTLFQGYQDGIRSVGWQGDPCLVRLGFTSAMLRVQATFVLRTLESISEDGQVMGRLKQRLLNDNLSLEVWAESLTRKMAYLFRLFEESLELRTKVNLDRSFYS